MSRRDYDDDGQRAIRAAFERDDTPTAPHGLRPAVRGSAVCRGVVVSADVVAGEFVGSDKPTPDPADLKLRRVVPNKQLGGSRR